MDIIMSPAWQAIGEILFASLLIVIVLNCTIFADRVEEVKETNDKNNVIQIYWK